MSKDEAVVVQCTVDRIVSKVRLSDGTVVTVTVFTNPATDTDDDRFMIVPPVGEKTRANIIDCLKGYER